MTDPLIRLDEFAHDPSQWIDPYQIYPLLREAGPVFYEPWGIWMISRHEHVDFLLRHPGLGSAPRQLGRGVKADGEHQTKKRVLFYRLSSLFLFNLDPPDHTRLRGLVAKALTPRVVNGLRPGIQASADRLIDSLVDAGSMEFVNDYAYPFPIDIIGLLLGVPAEDRPYLQRLGADITDRFFFEPRQLFAGGRERVDRRQAVEVKRRGDRSVAELADYFRGLAAQRRVEPADDLITGLVSAAVEGDRLNEDELVGMCLLILFAGHETTANLMANALVALLGDPVQLEIARRDLPLDRTKVEELVRFDPSIQHAILRTAREDIEVGGQVIRRDDRVCLWLGSANRDPERFACPDRLDLARAENPNVTFGGGPHYCLGASLARAEMEIGLSTVLARLPGLELATDAPVWRNNFTRRGPLEVPLRWTPPRVR